MRLLADENTHRRVVMRLRDAGFNVEWIQETTPGVSDMEILARSDISATILITNDRDFGDLVFNHGQPAPLSIVYTRLPHRAVDSTSDRIIALLSSDIPAGQMITVTKDGNRFRPFPAGA